LEPVAGSDFTTELTEVLKDYTDDAKIAVNKAVEKCGKGLKKDISATAPERTGSYKKNWVCKFSGNGIDVKSATVKNKKHYQLTHLLEKGHKKRGGKGRVKAYVHIAPAAEKWTEEFEQLCKEACKG